tara:strand:- start:27118 stop:27546 length:429 start_codon:yes stop_codon:yes gene_type:complete
MKTLVLILTALVSLNGFAQKRGGEKLSPEQMASLSTKKMTLALDLNESQQAKVYALSLENASKRQAKQSELKALRASADRKRPSRDEQFAMRSEMLDHQIAQKAKMEAILNKDQFTKWEKMQQQQKRKMANKMESRKGRNQR